MSMESPSSSSGGQHPHLPPGFRFHPTDEELVVHYLKKKVDAVPLPVTIIAEIDLYKYDPWELPSKASFGEHEWYFFTPRDRKYPNGARPNRAATSGYWKATGTDKPIHTGNGTQKVAVKKALVFYGGKPPRGVKTNWIMHEYRLLSSNSSSNTKFSGSINALNNKGSLRLDDWVLCRIFKKTTPSNRALDHNEREESMDEMLVSTPNSSVDGYPHPVLQCSENPESFFPRMISENESGAQFHQSQYWDNLPMNNGPILSNKQWQGGSDGDDNNNNNNKSNSFISILNQNSQSNAPFINHNSLDNSIGDDDGFLYKFPSFSK